MTNLSGRTLGPYLLQEQIGGGGMATVYKAYQPAMDRFVAIKVIRADGTHDPEFRERFAREARILARLEHRSILPVYDAGEAEGIPYLVMRYTDAGTLSDLIAQQGVPVVRAIDLVAQVGEALAYAHGHNVIHRDIKPANILIGRDGNVLLTDFGIAKMMEATLELTGADALIGTPFYMAPEQIMRQPVDARTDIYALGVVLYECLTGHRPFVAETPWAVLDMHMRDPLPSLRQANPAIADDLERVVLKATAKAPEHRFQQAAAMVAALHGAREVAMQPPGSAAPNRQRDTLVLAERDLPATAAPTAKVAQPERAPRRWGIALALGLSVLAIVLVGILLLRESPPMGSPADERLIYAETFAQGNAAGWSGDADRWQVVKDEEGDFVYEGQAPPENEQSASPPEPLATGMHNYAVELRARVVQPSTPHDDFYDMFLKLRTNGDSAQPCESYDFYFDTEAKQILIALSGRNEQVCPYRVLKRAPFALEQGKWYNIRAEASGTNLSVAVDGAHVLTATDSTLSQGAFYISVGRGGTVNFDDFRVLQGTP